MFRNWGFLMTEMIGLIILAALLGLFVGWLIWGRRGDVASSSAEAEELRAQLDACGKARDDQGARIRALEAQLGEAADLRADLEACNAARAALEASATAMPAASVPDATVDAAGHGDAGNRDYDGDGIVEGKDEGTKPATLSEARAGGADDLKRIKGIGPKMEQLCNRLGFFHFDQIASWTDQEVAWVDANLEGFRGRVTRDDWVSQAKLLAAGETTEFSQRVDKGEVY